MDLKLFALYNKVYGKVEGVITAPTVGIAIRDNLKWLRQAYPHLFDDIAIYEIGYFVDFSPDFISLETSVEHSWLDYQDLETSVKPLTDEQKKDLAVGK